MKIITLSREYGAGGHTIGTSVAKRLGIEFYDKDIIKRTAVESGVDPKLLEKTGEERTLSESILSVITPAAAVSQKDYLYKVQCEIILQLAAKGPCVILGRCADDIFERAGIESIDVFLYSDDVHRAKRIGEMIGSTDNGEILRAMKKADRSRHEYYNTYTGKTWGNPTNYDLMLNTGCFGYEKCIDLICEAAKAE